MKLSLGDGGGMQCKVIIMSNPIQLSKVMVMFRLSWGFDNWSTQLVQSNYLSC